MGWRSIPDALVGDLAVGLAASASKYIKALQGAGRKHPDPGRTHGRIDPGRDRTGMFDILKVLLKKDGVTILLITHKLRRDHGDL